MSDQEESFEAKEKCGYCGYLIKNMNIIWDHSCFEDYDEESQFINIDENHVVTMVTQKVVENNSQKEKQQRWNSDWDELLIQAVSKRPALYNYRLPLKERTLLKTNDLWQEISNTLGVCSVKIMQSRWATLKAKYMKEKEKERAYKRSGSAAPTKTDKEREFQLFEMMTFLDDLSKPIRTITSLSSESEDEDANQNNQQKSRDVRTAQYYEILLESLAPSTKMAFDPVQSCLLSLGPTLRKLDERRRMRVQEKFTKILMDELEDQEESDF